MPLQPRPLPLPRLLLATSPEESVTLETSLSVIGPGWALVPFHALLTARGAERVQEAKAGPYTLHTDGQAKAWLSVLLPTLTSQADIEAALLCVETWGEGSLVEAPLLRSLGPAPLTLLSLLVEPHSGGGVCV